MAEATPLELITATQAARVEASLTLLSAVADPVRWTVLRHLAENGTSCVCDLQDRVPVASNLLSYHLKVLRDAGLVTSARRGRWIDYTLAPDASKRLADALPVSTAGPLS
ncbi:MAG: ArsR/SmtB family transcription factor [Nocardioides sp.]